MKKFILKILPLVFLLALPVVAHLQTISTTAGSVTSCPDDIVVPIDVTNFNNVGAVSLVMNYNGQTLAFQGYQDLHPSMASGSIIVNSTGDAVFITWASSTGATFGDGVMMKLKFAATPGSSILNWDTQTSGNCEYSHINGSIIPATFTNGAATIHQPPVITAHPENKTVLVGQNTSLGVVAYGTNITYKWFVSINNGLTWSQVNNGGNYSGATTPTLSIAGVPLTYNGYLFRAEITGTCSPVAISNYAVLTVVKPLITSFNAPNVCPGSILIPVLTSNFTDVASFSLSFSYNPDVLTFTGYQNLNALITPGNFVCNSLGGNVFMSWASGTPVSFTGDSELVSLKFEAAVGSTNLNWNTSLAGHCEYTQLSGEKIIAVFQNGSFTVYQPPVITSQPVNKLIPEFTNTSISLTAQASGINYQWQVSTNNGITYNNLANTGFYSGVTTASLGITGANLSLSGNLYRCVIGGICAPAVNSNPAKLTVLPKITTTVSTVTGCPENDIVVPINVQRFIDVASFSLTLNYNPNVLTFSGYQSLNENLSGADVLINAANGSVLLTGYSATPITIGDNLLVELIFTGTPGSSALTWNTLIPGACEYVTLDGTIIFSNFVNGNMTVYQPPVISAHPINKTIYIGGSATFSVTASGASLSYQWQVSTDDGGAFTNLSNGSNYSGVNTPNLTINPAAAFMNGYSYRCYVSGTCSPFQYSNPATLTVTQIPVYTVAGSVLNSCTGNVTVPIQVTNCNNIGGISLVLLYDTTKLSFMGYDSAHPELTGGFLIVNQVANKVILSWASLNPANIGTGTLVQYHFIANAGITTTVNWDTQTSGNCEYSNINGNAVTSFFTNGAISVKSNALIVNAGQDVTITPGGSTQLNGTVTGGVIPYSYSWTPATGLSNPDIINPLATPAATTIYRLTVSDNIGCVAWDEVVVNVEVLCPTPSSLFATGITATGADLNWTNGGTENKWDVLWGLSGFNPVSQGTLVSGITLKPHNLGNLQSATSYDFYIRAVCDGGFVSSWSGSESFTTLSLHTINIPQGWSGLSSYIIPQISDVTVIFQPVITDLIILESQTGIYWPEENINTIVAWDSHDGYMIKAANPLQLTITGAPEQNLTLQLSVGWNLIPALSECEVDVATLFAGKDVTIVKEMAGWHLYWPMMGINTLENLLPGKAYYVKMESAEQISFPECMGLKTP